MRYTDPVRIRYKGAKNVAAQYISEARKYLGGLDEQLKLGGISVGARQLTNSDGVVFRVLIVGGQLIIEIDVRAVKRGQLAIELMGGLAVQPRTFADDNAFGVHPEAILMPLHAGEDDERWLNYLYDNSYLVGDATANGFYKTTKEGKPLLAGGLPGHPGSGGYPADLLDWRNADESVAVCWHQSASRYFDNGNADQGDGKIYYNGQLLIDVETAVIAEPLGYNRWVLGAAIHGSNLLFVVADKFGFNTEYYFRFYKAVLRPDTVADPWLRELPANTPVTQCPRLQEITATEDVTLLLTVPYNEQSGYGVARFAFNQSANECRAILHTYLFDGDDRLRVSEFVTDFRAHLIDPDNAVTYTDTVLNTLSERRMSGQVISSWRVNALNTEKFGTTPPPAPQGSSYPFFYSIGDGHCQWLPMAGTYTNFTEYVTAGGAPVEWYRGAVDFQDDVPVYLDYRTPKKNRTETLSDGSAQALNQATWDEGNNGYSDIVLTASASATVTGVSADRGAGFRCTDKNGVVWLQCLGTVVWSYSYVGTSDFSGTAIDYSDWQSGNFTASQATDSVETKMFPCVFYLDMRYRCAAYTLLTQVTTKRTVVETTASAVGGGFLPTWTRVGIGGTAVTTRVETDTVTKVVMYGAEVASYTGADGDVDTVESTSGTYLYPVDPYQFEKVGWIVLLPVGNTVQFPINDDTRFSEEVFDPPNNFNSYYNNVDAPFYDDQDQAPNGVFYWELTLDPVTNSAGDWVVEKHLSPAGSVRGGAWGCLANGWIYSMADLSGDIAEQKWDTRISGGDKTVDELTGKHGLESLGKIWPLSQFVSSFTASR